MVIEVHDGSRAIAGVIDIPVAGSTRPARAQAGSREVLLLWEGALDDGGCLRRCVVCGCPRLHRARRLPHVTPILLALCAVAVGVAMLGYAAHPALVALIAVLIGCDIAVLCFAKTHLTCYGCQSVYRGVAIARWHRNWDPITAIRLARSPLPPATGPSAGR
ncbi:MAG: hypothetical protein O2819_00130 [Planctomycetota bacterium]|nr:hypothetical protein [Planctomycetota bacterium]MDA1105353.1 hypothetical protein [Planctomycetota bacterium]